MLSQSKLQSIIWSADLGVAEAFYRDVLGLEIKDKSDGAVVFDVGGSDLRVSPVPSTTLSEHTVLGFAVPDVDRVIAEISSQGVAFETFEGLPHEPNGAIKHPRWIEGGLVSRPRRESFVGSAVLTTGQHEVFVDSQGRSS